MAPAGKQLTKVSRCDRLDRSLAHLLVRSIQGVAIFIAGLLLPLPNEIWYFGDDPQWIFAIEEPRLTVEPSTGPVMSSMAALFALRMLLVGVPMLIVGKMLQRPRRSRRSGVPGAEPT